MRQIIIAVVALLLVASVGVAYAADIEGKVRSVSSGDRTFTLEDGTELSLAEGVNADTLKEGSSVKASYEERDGKKVVTSIEVSN